MKISNFFTLLILLLGLTFFQCSKKSMDILNPVPTDQESTLNYLALGDSYTIGESVARELRFPNQLVARLEADSIAVDKFQIIATTGWTTGDLQKALQETELEADTFDLVSLLIGVNNQFQGRSQSEYRTQFTQLLDQAIQLTGGQKDQVFVYSIPDYAYTPYGRGRSGISEGVDAFNAINKEITETKGVVYFNITPISRRGVAEPDLVASDGLHPSGKQYGLWVDSFYMEIKQLVD